MEFSEKLSVVLSMTETKNVEIARALNIDPTQISRIRNGVRPMPAKSELIHDMAEYLSIRCADEYRLSALYELTLDARLGNGASPAVIANVIFDWLTSKTGQSVSQDQVDHFLKSLRKFSIQNIKTMTDAPEGAVSPLTRGSFMAYYNNCGKRQAVRDAIQYLLSLKKPCQIHIFSDESMSWLQEEPAFNQEIMREVAKLVKRGFQFQRIQPPVDSTESAFRSIERWMPAYMSGAIRLYYYPWTRDTLHRRTILVASGNVAICSFSLFGQQQTAMTGLTTDAQTVKLLDEFYTEILNRCRPMMSVHTPSDPTKFFEHITQMSAIDDFAIYKTNQLSVQTLPPPVIDRIRKLHNPFAKKMSIFLDQRIESRKKVLMNHIITDIMCLPELQDVLSGKTPIPGMQLFDTERIYYSPEEYGMHLESILQYLEMYPRYRVVLLDDELLQHVILYVKGDERAFLIKESDPVALFEITERTMTSELSEYMYRLTADKIHMGSRKETIRKLQTELKKLKSAVTQRDREASGR